MTAPVQWLASKRVTWMWFSGSSSSTTGVSIGKGFFTEISSRPQTRSHETYKQVFKVLVSLHACFQDSLRVVEATWEAFKANEHFSRSGRTVNATTWSVVHLVMVVEAKISHTMETAGSPGQQGGRCGCGSRSMPEADGDRLADGRSRP